MSRHAKHNDKFILLAQDEMLKQDVKLAIMFAIGENGEHMLAVSPELSQKTIIDSLKLVAEALNQMRIKNES